MNVQEAVGEYILSTEANGLSLKTVNWYRSLLSGFADDFGRMELEEVTTRMIRQYIVKLRNSNERYVDAPQKPTQEGGLSDATVRGHVTALHAFWNWCIREYEIENPMKNIKRPRVSNPEPKAISPEDFIRIFEAADHERDQAILCFLADTGCRLQGIINLKMEHLHLADHRALVWEKGNKSRMIYFTQYTHWMLEEWLAIRDTQSPYVFVSLTNGEQLTDSGINQLLKRLKKKAGVVGRVNPHSFRHNFAREYIQNGGDLATLAKLLGHNDIKTTAMYYAVFTPEELERLHEKYSPINSMLGE